MNNEVTPLRDPTETSASPPRARQLLWTIGAPALIAVVAAVLAWGRIPGAARGSMWAEDALYFSERVLHPELLTAWIFTPLDGYSHAVPQLAAIVLWWFVPVGSMAAAFTAAACALAGMVAAGVFVLSHAWNLNIAGRLLLAFTTVLAPTLAYEVLGNLANVHWFLLWFTPFVLLATPRSWWASGLLAAVAFLIVTTEIQAILFAPLLLWRLRDRRRWPIIGGVVLGGIIQALALLSGSPERGNGRPTIAAIIDGYFLQVPLSTLAGTGQGASAIVGFSGWAAAYLAIVPFALGALWFAWGSRRRWGLVAVFAGGSVVLWSLGFAINYFVGQDFSAMDRGLLTGGLAPLRYSAVPIMLVLALIALGVGFDRGAKHRQRLSYAGVGALALCLALFAASYRVDDHPARANGPLWAVGVQEAKALCDSADPPHEVTIPAAPRPAVKDWQVSVPCERMR